MKIIPLIACPENETQLRPQKCFAYRNQTDRDRERNNSFPIFFPVAPKSQCVLAVIIWSYWLIGPQTERKNIGLEETRNHLQMKQGVFHSVRF